MIEVKKIDFADSKQLTPAEMNALHIETGEHSDAIPFSESSGRNG